MRLSMDFVHFVKNTYEKALFYVGEGDTNAVAEKKAKMTDEFITFKKQQAFVKQIEQFILLAKKQATITVNNGG